MARSDSNVVISAFTEEQAARLTGLTVHQLRHWDKTEFYQPEFGSADRSLPYSRVYSFRDLTSLQVLKVLRIDLGCSLQHLREVKLKLANLNDLWSRTSLFVVKRKVVFYDAELDEKREAVSGQIVMEIPLEAVRANMVKAVESSLVRTEDEIGTIARKRNVNHNAAVVSGTRIPVRSIQRLAEDGYDTAQIVREYPSLTEADVRAALDFAGEKHAA